MSAVRLVAPAKLTLSLRVTGVRDDGYHLLDAEMVSLDLADTLVVEEETGGPTTLTVDVDPAGPAVAAVAAAGAVPAGPGNLVVQALAAVDRRAAVALTKRIPPGAGLGGGSADAGAVLRWAGCDDPVVAAAIGADVAFCVHGGRARVEGIGEVLTPLAYEPRAFLLLVSPFGVDTATVYRTYDRLGAGGDGSAGATTAGGSASTTNDLEAAALEVEPRLAAGRAALAAATGEVPRLAGSGSTWFVEVDPEDERSAAAPRPLATEAGSSWLVPARTTPAAP